jgi:hypothetical protein
MQMFLLKSRREREKIIVQTMINLYCAGNHANKTELCEVCADLANYAEKRLLSCMYGDIKPVCKKCPVHCYSPQKREQMREVMRWSGPRMLQKKPFYAMVHFIDNLFAPKPIGKLVRRKSK